MIFSKDEDYIELDRSPTNFDSSDDEEVESERLDTLSDLNLSEKKSSCPYKSNSFKLNLRETYKVR